MIDQRQKLRGIFILTTLSILGDQLSGILIAEICEELQEAEGSESRETVQRPPQLQGSEEKIGNRP